MGNRISYIDVTKGLLIILLMFSHTFWCFDMKHVESTFLTDLSKISSVWNCFFMACFFLITGMCSNFNKSFLQTLKSNFKSLIFPAIVFCILFDLRKYGFCDFAAKVILKGGGFWFLSALFLSKLTVWLLNRWIRRRIFIIVFLLILTVIGKCLSEFDFVPNYWYHRNYLFFTLFVSLGNIYKDQIISRTVGILSTLLFIITVSFLLFNELQIPNVVSQYNESLQEHPLTLLLSISGSITCIHLCKLINKSALLEYFGRNSLMVYMYHMVFLSIIVQSMLPSLLNICSKQNIIFLIICTVVTTLYLCSLIIWITDFKYTSWIKGKF